MAWHDASCKKGIGIMQEGDWNLFEKTDILIRCFVCVAKGDVICQKLQKRNVMAPVDISRTLRFSVVGLTMHGPFFLYGYRWLDTFASGPPSFKGVG